MAADRPAVRIICVDGSARILLMRWRDPLQAVTFWEPPGGGIDDGETPLQAARRELREETGLPGAAVLERSVPVHRDFHWLGTHYVKVEPFFLARFDGTPDVAAVAFTAEESSAFRGYGWFTVEEIRKLREPVDPPDILDVIARLLATH